MIMQRGASPRWRAGACVLGDLGKVGLLVVLLVLAGCRTENAPELARTSGQSTSAPTLPALSIEQTSVVKYVVKDFNSVHSPVGGDVNRYLILGKLPVSRPSPDLPSDLSVFLGRWEGCSYSPPVKKDQKLVLVIQEITRHGGKAVGWSGTNLQYPEVVAELNFRVVPGDAPAIEWQVIWPNGSRQIDTFTYDRLSGLIRGWSKNLSNNSIYGPWELSRERSFFVYKDYARYLAGKRIYSRAYENIALRHYGKGYLLYLPEGYEDHPEKTWPLLFFLHGYGDRGDNVFLLAKASPFMYIRDKAPLPFIIVAPLLNSFEGYSSFPEAYIAGVLEEIRTAYRVSSRRIYMTGLSMGGEATYRFAVRQPEMFAAIAPLSAYVDSTTYSSLSRIRDLPVWAIHGSDDTMIPLARAQEPVDALREAGSAIKLTVLSGYDHDTWTHTYSDPAFYDWFLQYQRP